jgi:hypothetical protein
MGNLQVRFLEGWAPAMVPGYSTLITLRQVARDSGTIAIKMRRRTASPDKRLSVHFARMPFRAHIREGVSCMLTPRCTCILGCALSAASFLAYNSLHDVPGFGHPAGPV